MGSAVRTGGDRTSGTRTRGLRSRASAEVADYAEGIRRASAIGSIAYAGFAAVDVLLYLLVYEQASLDRIIAYRVAGVGILFGWYFYARSTHATLRSMVATTGIVLGVTALVIGLIANELGGLASPYVPATSFYFVAIAVLVPSPWRRTLAMLVPVFVGFFAAVTIASWITQPAAWASTQGVTHYLVSAFIQVSLLAFAAIASHLLWASRAPRTTPRPRPTSRRSPRACAPSWPRATSM